MTITRAILPTLGVLVGAAVGVDFAIKKIIAVFGLVYASWSPKPLFNS
jgi:hypothetical protein